MRAAAARAGLEDRVEVDSAGTGGWHVGDAAGRARATAAAAARGVTLEGAARTGRAGATSRDFDLLLAADRAQPARRCARSRPTRTRRAKVQLLREFDPDAAGAPDLDVPDPYYGGADGFEHGARPGRGGLPRAARRPARRRPRCDRGSGRARPRPAPCGAAARRRRRHQRRLAARARGRPRAFVKTRAGRARRASTRPRPPGCAGSREPAAPRVPAVLGASTTRFLALEWIDGGPARRGRRGGGSGRELARRCTRAGAPAFGAPPPGAPFARAAARRRRRSRPRPATTGRRSTPSAGSRRCCARRGPRRAAGGGRRAVRARCASGSPSSPGRPSRRRACTATCGAATCWPARTAAPG